MIYQAYLWQDEPGADTVLNKDRKDIYIVIVPSSKTTCDTNGLTDMEGDDNG